MNDVLWDMLDRFVFVYLDDILIFSSDEETNVLQVWKIHKNAGLLKVPRVSKSRMGTRAFSYRASLLWNQIPVSVRGADALSTFKSRLKTFLFDKAHS